MAVIAPEKTVVTGLEPTLVAAVGPDTFVNNGSNTVLIVDNAGGGSITVTIDGTGVGPTGAVAFDDDVDVVVANGTRRHIGPFPKDRFGATVSIAYSGVSSVTVAVVTL